MKKLPGLAVALVLGPVLLLSLGRAHRSRLRAGERQDDAQEAREEAFARLLTGARLDGWFSDSNHPDGPPIHDFYTISKAEKADDERWQITALIGESGLELPLLIPVKWAGDTPVMTLDQFPVPQMGTFDARVLFHGTSYAGVWSGAKHSGEMAGRIERVGAGKVDKLEKK